MATAPKKTTTTRTTVISKAGTTTTSTSTVRQGGNVTTTKSTTIRKAGAPARASTAKKSSGGSGGGRKAKAPAKFASVSLADTWVRGPGDVRPMCAPVAVANSLLDVLGVTASDGAIERLYKAAGGWQDSGVPVESVLTAAADTGLAGCRLAGWHRVDGEFELTEGLLLLLALDFTPDTHAVATIGGGQVATWGEALNLSELPAQIEAAWSLTWHGKAQ